MKILLFVFIVAVLSLVAWVWAKSQKGLMAKSLATTFAAPSVVTLALLVLFPFFFGFTAWMLLSLSPLLIPAGYMVNQLVEFKEEFIPKTKEL